MATKITDSELNKLSTEFKIPYKSIKSVMEIESAGSGFRSDGFPKILFEPKWFNQLTGGKYLASHPSVARVSYDPAYYKANPDAKKNFETAKALNSNSAMQATSWGLGQIMGFNYKKAGFPTVEDMVSKFKQSEYEQAKGMFNFIKSDPSMLKALIDRNWSEFAKRYNGPEYAKMAYDTKLKAAYESAKDFAGTTTGKLSIVGGILAVVAVIALLIYLVKKSGGKVSVG